MVDAIKVAVYWGDILYDTILCHPKDSVVVGKTHDSTVVLNLDGKRDKLRLIQVNDDTSMEIFFDEFVDGHARIGNEVVSLSSARIDKRAKSESDGVFSLSLSSSDTAELVIGYVTFLVERGHTTPKVERAAFFDRSNLIAFFIFMVVCTGVGYWVHVKGSEDLASNKPPERLITLVKDVPKPTPKPEEKKKNAPAEAAIGEKKTKDGGAQKGEKGKADLIAKKPDKTKKKADVQQAAKTMTAPINNATSMANELRNANLGNLVSGLSSLTANSAGPAPKQGTAAAINQVGTGGFTTEGFKKGGGGKTVGIGRAVGNGEGGFEGTGRLGLAGNNRGALGTGRGTRQITNTNGGLDREIIDGIVRQRQDRIRLCYERQLNFEPSLSGKISIRFSIGKKGDVLSADTLEDSMKSDAVRSCLLKEVRTWTFPPPQGGTLVTVDYPFVFESSARGTAGG